MARARVAAAAAHGARRRPWRAQLRTTDAETPLALFASYASLAADFPPLPDVVTALERERDELGAMPNLTQAALDYAALEETISSWQPETISSSR